MAWPRLLGVVFAFSRFGTACRAPTGGTSRCLGVAVLMVVRHVPGRTARCSMGGRAAAPPGSRTVLRQLALPKPRARGELAAVGGRCRTGKRWRWSPGPAGSFSCPAQARPNDSGDRLGTGIARCQGTVSTTYKSTPGRERQQRCVGASRRPRRTAVRPYGVAGSERGFRRQGPQIGVPGREVEARVGAGVMGSRVRGRPATGQPGLSLAASPGDAALPRAGSRGRVPAISEGRKETTRS